MRDRISSWQKRLLTRGGKEVLLMSVAQAMPIFAMLVFLLPATVCDNIEKAMNRFWWNKGVGESKGIHWFSWLRMDVSKCSGGLGFKRLREFNIALLAKQGWRLLVNPQSFVTRLLKAKYYLSGSFLEASLRNNPSYI